MKNSPDKFSIGEKGMYKDQNGNERNTSDDKDMGKAPPAKNSPQHAGWADSDSFKNSVDDNARIDRALKEMTSRMATEVS